jgi:hypothetical protein
MKFLIALSIVISFFGIPANAEEGVWVLGYFDATCGTWTKERHVISPARGAYQGWVTGFLSGWAIDQPTPNNPLIGLDTEGVYAWVDNYCSVHPLDTLMTATKRLMSELAARRKGSN